MDFNEFFRLATGGIPGPIQVGRVSGQVKHALGAHTRVVWLSRNSIEKQLSRHSVARRGPRPSAYYDYIGDTIAHGRAFRLEGNRVGLVLDVREMRGYRFQVVVKVTADRNELYTLSFSPLRKHDWSRLCRRNNPIPNIAA